MPYISLRSREFAAPVKLALTQALTADTTPDELAHLLLVTALQYADKKGPSFTSMSELIGTVEIVKGELLRRLVAPFNDDKIQSHGDI